MLNNSWIKEVGRISRNPAAKYAWIKSIPIPAGHIEVRTLFLVWIALNGLDLLVANWAIHYGATEVGILYQIFGSWMITVISKMFLCTLVGGILLYFKKYKWLLLLTLGITLICIYNSAVLLWQWMSG